MGFDSQEVFFSCLVTVRVTEVNYSQRSPQIPPRRFRRTTWLHQVCHQGNHPRSRPRRSIGCSSLPWPLPLQDKKRKLLGCRRNVHWPVHLLWKESHSSNWKRPPRWNHAKVPSSATLRSSMVIVVLLPVHPVTTPPSLDTILKPRGPVSSCHPAPRK